MENATFSIVFGRFFMIHFRFIKIVGISTRACFKGLAHYNLRRKPLGKSMRNMPGDLTHYNGRGDCIGYSRRLPLGRTQHYNKSGEKTGHSQRILWIFAFHHHTNPQENE